MKRSILTIVGACMAGAVLIPAAASAKTIELGATTTPVVAPTCPSGVPKQQCTIILTESTALESSSDSVVYPTTVKTSGRIVAYTLGMAKLAKTDITALDNAYGGPSQVQLVVLHQVSGKRMYKVKAITSANMIQPFFGTVTTWPLHQTLGVQKGDLIGLSVKTWAPVLAINLPHKPFQYRASRNTGCAAQSTFSTENAQLSIGNTKQYLCFYTATRVEYTATEVTNPVIPKGAVK